MSDDNKKFNIRSNEKNKVIINVLFLVRGVNTKY